MYKCINCGETYSSGEVLKEENVYAKEREKATHNPFADSKNYYCKKCVDKAREEANILYTKLFGIDIGKYKLKRQRV